MNLLKRKSEPSRLSLAYVDRFIALFPITSVAGWFLPMLPATVWQTSGRLNDVTTSHLIPLAP
jgi:hypothetical protein